ncbi:STT3 domain-containing protein [Fervidicoccus fontis]|uniref:STT3 domain-containing protein n=1 Tax=Fervidicoccus fontis TaxID=683846 RepID=UPI00130526DB|nr:STT3 domain-containing protein [Fervidicoccus fontis]
MSKSQKSVKTGASFIEKLYSHKTLISLAIVIAISAAAFYIRMLRVFKYGYMLDEADPFIAYYATNYMVQHGISSWYSLTQSNPAMQIFWYPWGRDLAYSDYPLFMMLAALTYPIGKLFGLSVMQWVVIQPPIAGALIALFSYLLVREVTGEMAGIISAFMAAVLPGMLDRTIAGFFVKLGMVQPLIVLAFLFLVLMFKEGELKRKIIYTIISGVLVGLVAWDWGGYQVVDLVIGTFLVFYPLAKEPEIREFYSIWLFTAVTLIVQLLSPPVGLMSIIKGSGLFIIGGGIAYTFSFLLLRYSKKIALLKKYSWRKIYSGFLVFLAVVAVIMLYFNFFDISGRAYYFIGLNTNNALVASVSEHQEMTLSGLISEVGLSFILTVFYIVYGLFQSRKQPLHMFFIVLAVYSIIMGFKASYLLMFVATSFSITGGIVVNLISDNLVKAFGLKELKVERKKKSQKVNRDSIGITIWSAALIVIVVIGFIQMSTTIAYAQTPPLILSGGIGMARENDAWIYTLDYIKNDTPANSVILTWWDYGYWIPVMTGRATVADGATINQTQIQLLATILTSDNISEIDNIAFNELRTPQNATYVLTFDVFEAYKQSSNTWVVGPYTSIYSGSEGLADIPKSIWMLRIADRVNLTGYSPYFAVTTIPYQGSYYPVIGPNWTNPLVQSTLIYKMMIDGVYMLNNTDIVAGTVNNLTGNVEFMDYATGNIIPYHPLDGLQPVKIITDSIYSNNTTNIFVAVFLYKLG